MCSVVLCIHSEHNMNYKDYKGRQIIYPGKGEIPEYSKGTKVTFHFKTIKRDDEGQEVVVDDSKNEKRPMELIIGKQFKLVAWEEMIKKMRIGEVAKVKLPKIVVVDYPFVSKCYRQFVKKANNEEVEEERHCCGMKQSLGYRDLDELMEKPQDLEFIIEIVNVEPPECYEKEIWQMENDEKFESITKFREEGNQLYAKKMYKEAAEYYSKALGIIEQLILREKPGDDEWIELDKMKIPLLCNFAQCKLIEGDFYGVIEHTSEVLKKDENNVKALFRRAKAHAAVWNIEEAKQDFIKASQLDSSLSKVILNELKQLDIKSKQKDEEDKNKLKGKLFN